ncbi:hypothetical protein [Streptacidiphilus fuscans]|uniref:Uncharacterized protein n=1 Tax=Streptacidiphilus fuscans TaxID=2789292 RepID=A0A931B836_9ACTN|nr:hypothetical protein [Streptacidiphilus fuscans]MBF9071212.1 hypothetical protein [Streptacidiphilus fuscans]
MSTDPTPATDGRSLAPDVSVVAKLGAEPGLCATCAHVHLNETRRGTAYLRCTRATWDAQLPRYPRLPVLTCPGFEQRSEPASD